jgi:ribosome-binding factor A
MAGHHSAQVAEELTHAAAQYLAREAGRGTLITVTHANVAPDGKNATVFVTVFPSDEADHAIAFLGRHRDGFRDYLRTETRIRRAPAVRFQLDPDAHGKVV